MAPGDLRPSSGSSGVRFEWWLLAIILIAGAAARFAGLQFGFPHPRARPDEDAISAIAQGLFSGDLNPHSFNYPALFMLTVAAVMRVVQWTHVQVTDTVHAYMVARVLSATAGTLSILVVYRIAARLAGRDTGLVAAAFLALAFLHVRDSHFGVTDVSMTFMTLMGFLWIVRFWQSGRTRDLVVAGLLAGLATATKYNAALLVAPALAAIMLDSQDTGWQRRAGRFATYAACLTGAFLVAAPYSVLSYGRFIHDVMFESRHLANGHGVDLGRGWIYHLTTTLRFGMGLPLLAAGIGGLVVMGVRAPSRAVIAGAFPVLYYVLIGSGRTVFARYTLPLIPFLCVFAAWGVTEFARWAARRTGRPSVSPAIAVAVSVLLLWPSAASVVSLDTLLRRADSRVIARLRIERRFPPGTAIAHIGPEAGHVFLGDASEVPYTLVRFTEDEPEPWLVIVQTSPLTGSHATEWQTAILGRDYELQFAIEAVRDNRERVYDRQDEFYLPLSGFEDVERPGPNLAVYQRRN